MPAGGASTAFPMKSVSSKPCARSCGVKKSGWWEPIVIAIPMRTCRRILTRRGRRITRRSSCLAMATNTSSALRKEIEDALQSLNCHNPAESFCKNHHYQEGRATSSYAKLEPQPEPANLLALKAELAMRWPMTSLLDMLKETALRVRFTDAFRSATAWENLDQETLQHRLLLCLYGIGTNAGIKRMSAGDAASPTRICSTSSAVSSARTSLRYAIGQVVNETLRARNPVIWGEGTTACASDSKKFGAWDQNLITEWHLRYGGRGVMIYWHVERKSLCIYSQLKTCSSSEVAAMIEGVMRHCTEMSVDRQYVDTHGQSEVAFAFCRLLGFELLPRFKGIAKQKLYRPGDWKAGCLSQSGGHPDACRSTGS